METTAKTTKFKSFYDMLQVLPDDNACRLFLEDLRWKGTPVCPHCGSVNENHYKLNTKGVFNGLYKCKDCRERFTVTVGTMFEGSHVPLRKWFIAIYIFTAHKKGISSIQLGKDLGITQKSAWFVLSRLRNNFSNKLDVQFEGIVEADETFVGGKNKNRHANKKIEGSQGRSAADKTPVIGLAQRQIVEYKLRPHKVIPGKVVNEKIVIQPSLVSCNVVSDTSAETLQPLLLSQIKANSKVVTDAYRSYNSLDKNFNHVSIKHTDGNYITVGEDHTNSIEGFWSQLKRGIFGIYHNVSPKHLNKYCDEFAFRYNTRTISDNEKFSLSLLKAENRLTYKALIAK
ncbi:MAG TPA: IS1595 family transposase [Mucilaginibacter sp.]